MTIYLDYNATAPIRPEVAARVSEVMGMGALNASSAHTQGRRAKALLEESRAVIAEAIGAFPNEIIFCASATEANAMALRGFPGRKVLVSAIEHSSVLRAGEPIPVERSGIINLASLESLLLEHKNALVSVLLANNETGVIQPVLEVAALCKKYGALFHCDAVQGLGKMPLGFSDIGCDLMTISAHKMGGPVGASALVIRNDLAIAPLLVGGGQELRRRAGTENVAAIAGFAKAVELIDLGQMERLREWMEELESGIGNQESGIIIFGKDSPRLPNTSCIAMPGVSQEVQLMNFDLAGFCVSAGSACSSGRIEPSHVLKAMGYDDATAGTAIRVSAGWGTTEQEVRKFGEAWISLYERLGKKAA